MKTVWSSLGRGSARAARWVWSSAMMILVGTPRLRSPGSGSTSSALAEAQLRSGAGAQMHQTQPGIF